jgi:hypothetical protein
MSVHDLARAASDDLRSHTAPDVDAGLEALFVAHARRRRDSRFAVALVAAAAVATVWWGAAGLGDHRTGPEPAPAPATRTPPVLVPQAGKLCQRSRVTCLGDRTYRFALNSPVEWQIPHGYGVDSGGGASSFMVESYAMRRGSSAGVTVMEGVRAASRHSPEPDPRVPATARAFVQWVALRPSLHASAVRRVTFDGRVAWHVRVSVRRHAGPGPGRCTVTPATVPCHPITYQDGAITGLWSDMSADYTALDLPGVGTVVVWSWAFGHDRAALARNRAVADAVSLTS